MSDKTQDMLHDIAREWLEARAVIARMLGELMPTMSVEHREHNAAAVIARLSHAGFSLTKDDQL